MMLSKEDREKYLEAMHFAENAMRLDGFEKTDFVQTINEAVLAGRVTIGQVNKELIEYVREHKTTDGFLENREWL